MADTSISEAFPTFPVSILAAILDDFDLVPSIRITELLALDATVSDVLMAMADYLIESVPDRQLKDFVPESPSNSQWPSPFQVLSTRPANGLRRSGVSSWKELTRLTSGDLLRLPALGRKSVAEIVAFVLHGAAVQLCHDPGGEVPRSGAAPWSARTEDTEPDISDNAQKGLRKSSFDTWASESLSGLKVLARWARCIGDVSTVGEMLDLAVSGGLPEDVTESLEILRSTSLVCLSEEEATVAYAYDFVWGQCGDDRQREIFRRRTLLNASTLEELGVEMSITRERVRQIQRAAEVQVSLALRRLEGSELRWRATQLRRELGSAIARKSPTMRAALNAATRGIPQDIPTAEALLLWIAGPYRLDKQTDWMFSEAGCLSDEVGPQSEFGPPPKPSLLRAVAGDGGVVDLAAARNRAVAAGLVAEAVEDWIALCPFRDLNGTLVLWEGSVADKAEAVLGVLKRPATSDELNDLIGEGHSVRSVRNRLLDDDRFIRTDRIRIGLRRWGLEEYTGIVDEIEEEIGRRGGEADVSVLVRALTEQFGLRTSSVASYTTVPRFVVDNGRIHVRRPNEPFVPTRTLFDEARSFLLDEDRCSYRIFVDGDVLRGSGRPLPQGVGAWLGVLPGTRRQFRFRDNDVLLISWPDSALTGPAIGSLRRQAVARSAEEGDSLLLEFDRSSDKVEAILVRQSEFDATAGWLRGTLLTGIDAGDPEEFEHLLAAAIGIPSVVELRSRCRDRGDSELARLVRMERSAELDAALERLKEVL